MDEFVIEGKAPLQGTVTPSGNKNAAFPLIAAALLTDEPVRLRNLPDITDVRTMLSLVEGLGVDVQRHDGHTVTLRASRITTTAPDAALLGRVRGGLVLTGPLLAREGEARLAHAGGDQIVDQPVTLLPVAVVAAGPGLVDVAHGCECRSLSYQVQ